MNRTSHLLAWLRYQPFLSREQLQRLFGWRKRTVQWYLQHARRAGLVRTYDGHLSVIPTKSLWTLTRAGLAQLAHGEGRELLDYLKRYQYDRVRLDRLALVLERVWQVRSFLIHLQKTAWEWQAQTWDVEVEIEFWRREDPIPYAGHGIALLDNSEGRSLALLIEYDLDLAPVKAERLRFAHLAEGMREGRFLENYGENKFPVLVILAANEERLHDYLTLLRELIRVGGSMPYLFLTTRDQLPWFYRDGQTPIWATERLDGERVRFCDGIAGTPDALKDELTWTRLPHPRTISVKRVEIEPLRGSLPDPVTQHDLATLSLALQALDRQVLRLVGSHPLLNAKQLALVEQVTTRSVHRSLRRLRRWGLIEEHRLRLGKPRRKKKLTRAERQSAKAHYLTLTELGVRFFTASAGYGTAVERYARARGWKHRFGELVKHAEHTQLENEVFVQFVQTARRRGDELVFWRSDLEARLYIDGSDHEWATHYAYRRSRPRGSGEPRFGVWGAMLRVSTSEEFTQTLAARGQRMHSFLPDGRGCYRAGGEQFELQVEIDLSKVNATKLEHKLDYYFYAMGAEPDPNWRILFVTTGWKRAIHIARQVAEYARSSYYQERFDDLRGQAFLDELKAADLYHVFWRDFLPVYVTTIEALRRRGVAAPIWLDAKDLVAPKSREIPTTYCLDCFRPVEAKAGQAK